MSTADFNYKNLPLAQRIQLVADIWDSIAAETPTPLQLTAAELTELRRRFEEHQADPTTGIPWDKIRQDLLSEQSGREKSYRLVISQTDSVGASTNIE